MLLVSLIILGIIVWSGIGILLTIWLKYAVAKFNACHPTKQYKFTQTNGDYYRSVVEEDEEDSAETFFGIVLWPIGMVIRWGCFLIHQFEIRGSVAGNEQQKRIFELEQYNKQVEKELQNLQSKGF